MTKQCTLCGFFKDLTEFAVRSDTGKYRSRCKQCVNELHRDSYKNREPRKSVAGKVCPMCGGMVEVGEVYQAYCNACKSVRSAKTRWSGSQRTYYLDNRERALDNFLWRTYGITKEMFDDMLIQQNGGCAICGGISTPLDKTGMYRRMPVDHNHVTGRTRGILCNPCNTTLGNMHDDPALLRKAADYLERWF